MCLTFTGSLKCHAVYEVSRRLSVKRSVNNGVLAAGWHEEKSGLSSQKEMKAASYYRSEKGTAVGQFRPQTYVVKGLKKQHVAPGFFSQEFGVFFCQTDIV